MTKTEENIFLSLSHFCIIVTNEGYLFVSIKCLANAKLPRVAEPFSGTEGLTMYSSSDPTGR